MSEASWTLGAGHDPFCHQSEGRWDGGCDCDLIDRVRKDQMERDIERFSFMFDYVIGPMTDEQKERYNGLYSIITDVRGQINNGS